ncbi:hypothetical protein JCM33374_g5521 [Metschnikowia sp. JCM 33374]|nr:hypothetical protein JCM33374_g5521 [Metschnikowia sp. JCM 33374]
MSTHSIPFESINLEPSALQVLPPAPLIDTSDDGLDPNDFLSQSQTANKKSDGVAEDSDTETSLDYERGNASPPTPRGNLSDGITPSFSNSLNLSASRDSLLFSFGNLRDWNHTASLRAIGQNNASTVEHLLERHESLAKEMNTAISAHGKLLNSGEDCSGARSAITKIFELLSENSYLLQEVYTKEISGVDQTLSSFQAWDRKRAKVLSRIQKIKSENNEYGAKLGGLLARRSAIDHEIETLESRLDTLQSSRIIIDKEVDETMSVLESKSAKYVNMFRNLEKIGADAVRDYLGSDGSEEAGKGPLLRYENVNAMFSPENKTSKKTPPNTAATGKATNNSLTTEKPPSPHSMGAQAFEIPDNDGHDYNALHPIKDESAYEKGYAKGSEQLSIVKKKLSVLLSNVIPVTQNSTHETSTHANLDDSSNTITQKLDLSPIVDLLSSKSEALDDLVLQAATLSETFHKQGLVWSESCKFLDCQEELLLKVLSETSSTSEAAKVLENTYAYLVRILEEDDNKNIIRPDGQNDYLKILTSQELFTVATALDQISGKSHYVRSAISSKNFLAKPPLEAEKAKDFRYSITSISSQQVTPNYATVRAPARKMRTSTKYSPKISLKDIKNE